MKKLILLFITSLILTSFSKVSESDFNIVGKWKGEENSEVGYIHFDNEGYAYFEFNGQKIGGKEFILKGKKGSMRYEIEFAEKFMKIDLIVTIIDENKTKSLLCLAERLNNDEMRFTIGFEGERPKGFENNDSMIFKRVKG